MDPLLILVGIGIVLSVLKYFKVLNISWFWATIPIWSIPVATIMWIIMLLTIEAHIYFYGPVA